MFILDRKDFQDYTESNHMKGARCYYEGIAHQRQQSRAWLHGATALAEVAKELEAQGIETSIRWLGVKPIRDCVACGGCKNGGGCVFRDDPVNALVEEARNSDGFVFGTPVYYAHPSGRILCALDRMFYSGGSAFALKPGAAIASARRAGTTASVDVLNKYFTINQMPVVSSGYWNVVHGNSPEEVVQDLEGMQIMRTLGRNMAWLLKSIQKADLPRPEQEERVRTNFIR